MSDGVRNSAIPCEIVFEAGHERAAREGILVNHVRNRIEEFLPMRLVMRFQVQERYLHNMFIGGGGTGLTKKASAIPDAPHAPRLI